MPIVPTYPGVYVEELPSGVRTIVGVATSITAFLGRAVRGPVNRPVRIQSFGDYERAFGRLWFHSTLSYAVRHFFQNGGADALIVRLADSDGVAAAIQLATNGGAGTPLDLVAASGGEWGNRLRVRVTGGNLEVQEVLDPAASTIEVLHQASYPLASLEAALAADDSMIVPTTDPFPGDTPDDIGWTFLDGGENPALAATAALPVGVDVLQLEAAGALANEAGNALRATVVHSVTSAANFALILEQVDGSGAVIPASTEIYAPVTAATVGAALAGSALVAAPLATSTARPLAVTRAPFTGGTSTPATQATVSLSADSLGLRASNPGEWSNNLRATVDYDTADPGDTDLFNLTVEELDAAGNVLNRELFRNVTLDTTATRYIDTILTIESDLVETDGPLPATRPLETTVEFSGGDNGGELADADYQGSQANKTGLYALEDADLFNLMCIPPRTREVDIGAAVLSEALTYCQDRRAMLIVDSPASWNDTADAENSATGIGNLRAQLGGAAAGINAMVYFPRLRMPDPLQENRAVEFVPCGAVAGLIARTDAQRGVWKAPAGIEASLSGVRELSYRMTDGENGRLNPLGLNCIRTFPVFGHVVWGARTLAGDDRLASEWKYVPVRRTALYIEESLYRGLHWVVFEPNDESLWAQIRLNVTTFMQDLFRQGAFQGTTPRDAYLVKCDRETTTQSDIDKGIVNVYVGFAPLKPAEFVIIQIQQLAGQTAV